MIRRVSSVGIWALPLVVAAVIAVALLAGRSPEPSAPATAGSPAATSTTVGSTDATPSAGDTAGEASSPPTTGFAQRTPTLPAELFDYTRPWPATFDDVGPGGVSVRDLDSQSPENPVTDEGATLGRVLFYDVNLSGNRTVRCASCHLQNHSFADPLVLSQGLNGGRTRRNAMSLANATFNASGRFLWDESAATLEEQVLMPFEDQLEMNLPAPQLVERVGAQPYYEPLFVDAFGDAEITTDRIAQALAQFVRAMVSVQAPYDEGRGLVDNSTDPFPTFSDAENRGKALFMTPRPSGAGCASCHGTDVQVATVVAPRNNGLDPPLAIAPAPDQGVFETTGDLAQAGAFRVPSLRNVTVTGPYMHDGRLVTLDAVLDHYSQGLQPHENLATELRGPDGAPIDDPFTDEEKADLLAFLATLTDDQFLTDERFSEPFRG